MKANKIAFITCVNNEEEYLRCLEYINKLKVPEGIEIEKIAIRNAKSMTAGYNEAMKKSDAKYKVYIHQDVYIQNTEFINNVINIFKDDDKIGLIGMVGAKIIPVTGVWWDDLLKVGKVFDSHRGFIELLNFNEIQSLYTEVKGIDGLIMITQKDLPWREDVFDGWHFYDLSQSMEFINKGFKVVVPNQPIAWCIHDCGYVNTVNGFEEYRNKFLNTYSKVLFPLVSILIPSYNQTKYLEEAINSALNQSYRNIEIIISDDSTTNDVQELVKKYMLKNDKIKYINNGGPLGLKGQNNIKKCFDEAEGEYINYLLHDDIFHSNKIDRMVSYFLYDETISIVTSYRKMIDGKGNNLNDNFRTICQYPNDVKLIGEEAGKKILYSMINYIGELTTAMFKREAVDFDIVNYYEYQIHCLSDISLWLKLLRKGNLVYLSEPLSKFRIHEAQNTYDDTFTLWASIDFFHMIIASYEKGVFIKNRNELLQSLMAWYREYSGDLTRLGNKYNNDIENREEIMELKNSYLDCYNKFLDILFE